MATAPTGYGGPIGAAVRYFCFFGGELVLHRVQVQLPSSPATCAPHRKHVCDVKYGSGIERPLRSRRVCGSTGAVVGSSADWSAVIYLVCLRTADPSTTLRAVELPARSGLCRRSAVGAVAVIRHLDNGRFINRRIDLGTELTGHVITSVVWLWTTHAPFLIGQLPSWRTPGVERRAAGHEHHTAARQYQAWASSSWPSLSCSSPSARTSKFPQSVRNSVPSAFAM